MECTNLVDMLNHMECPKVWVFGDEIMTWFSCFLSFEKSIIIIELIESIAYRKCEDKMLYARFCINQKHQCFVSEEKVKGSQHALVDICTTHEPNN
jgi:hypothetical protein